MHYYFLLFFLRIFSSKYHPKTLPKTVCLVVQKLRPNKKKRWSPKPLKKNAPKTRPKRKKHDITIYARIPVDSLGSPRARSLRSLTRCACCGCGGSGNGDGGIGKGGGESGLPRLGFAFSSFRHFCIDNQF